MITRRAAAHTSCSRKLSSCKAPDRLPSSENPGDWRGPALASMCLLGGCGRIDRPLAGAEVAEQHLASLQIFLREAAARCWASVDRPSGDGGAAYDRRAGNRRDAHAAV